MTTLVLLSVSLVREPRHRLDIPSPYRSRTPAQPRVSPLHHVGAHYEAEIRQHTGDPAVPQSGEGSLGTDAFARYHLRHHHLRAFAGKGFGQRIRMRQGSSIIDTSKYISQYISIVFRSSSWAFAIGALLD